MKKRTTFVVILLALVALTSIYVGSTYAKYVSSVTGDATSEVAAWKVAVNTMDLTDGGTHTLTGQLVCTPTASEHVVSGKIAPGRGCTFSVVINATGSEVSVDYTIAADFEHATNLPDNVATELTGGNGTILLEDVGTPVTVTGTVTWPYDTDPVGGNDAEDTAAGIAGEEITIPVTVTLTQHNPTPTP